MAKVLIVDDSPMIRALIKNLVEQRNHETYEASCSSEALDQFHKVNPDVVYLDIIMDNNKLTGMEALKQMKKERPDAVVVMVTSISDQESIIKECVDYGANEYISKPFKDEEILEVLDTYAS